MNAEAENPKDVQKSCRNFVQKFYNWYLPAPYGEPRTGRDADAALRQRFLSPELFRDLKIDYDAQAKVTGEIVGLDFDPFLNAQNTWERCVIGKITHKKDSYWVEVFGFWDGKKSAKPDVVPELVLKNGKWRFVNFHYEKELPHYDLKNVLKDLRKERQTNSKK
jgi:hypothetical protein